jgi:hypothetical protein
MTQEATPTSLPENNLLAIFEWLQLANGRSGSDDAEQLLRQLLLLRDTPAPTRQRLKILDLIYKETRRVVFAELPKLLEINLPVSRKIRQRVRITQDLLEALTQEYFNTLAELFDPQGTPASSPPQATLIHITQCLAWHIRISHLAAAPNPAGLWQKLHSAFHSARRLGVHNTSSQNHSVSLEKVYAGTLLAAMAQPASFCARELEFIVEYVESSLKPVQILETTPNDCNGIFWVDLERDFPAHALVRRPPPGDTPVLFFTGDSSAQQANAHLSALEQGASAANLGLPAFADSHAGQGVLRRLQSLWGNPTKRKFPRRRQSYRINLCSGLEQLWHLIREPERASEISEWMVTNESPDGYSLMHMSGETTCVRVGDIVAVQAKDERAELKPLWHVCLVRWALSENPEHIELGLQQLASHVIAAELARPQELDSKHIPALILPKMPPLRPHAGIVVHTGSLPENANRLVLLIEKENLEIREVSPTELAEQTASIEVFNVSPVETP